MTATVSEVVDM